MRSQRKRSGVSEIIGVLLMLAITVAIGFIIVFYVQGLFSSLTKGGPSNTVSVVGQMSVPGTYDASGVLSLTVRNSGSTVVDGVTAACPATYFSSANCNLLSINVNGAKVAPGNLLTPGSTATGIGTVSACVGGPPGCLANSFTAGTTYVLIVTITYSNGSTLVVPVSVTSSS